MTCFFLGGENVTLLNGWKRDLQLGDPQGKKVLDITPMMKDPYFAWR